MVYDRLKTWSYDLSKDFSTRNAITTSGYAYDANGNLLHTSTASTAPQYDYDAWNRLAGYDTDVTVNASRYEYPYDALHRRAIDYKYVDYGNQLPQDPEIARIDLYYSDRWQVIEDSSEHSGLNSATTIATTNIQVWSTGYVDDLVLRDRKVTTTDGENTTEEEERLYAQHDHNFNVTSLVGADSSPAVEQRFVFDPYGAATAYTNNYQLTTNNFAWVYLHQGGRQNEINGLYSFRYRELNSSLGRWMQQDPAGYVDGASLYQAMLSSPVATTDWLGLQVNIQPGPPNAHGYAGWWFATMYNIASDAREYWGQGGLHPELVADEELDFIEETGTDRPPFPSMDTDGNVDSNAMARWFAYVAAFRKWYGGSWTMLHLTSER